MRVGEQWEQWRKQMIEKPLDLLSLRVLLLVTDCDSCVTAGDCDDVGRDVGVIEVDNEVIFSQKSFEILEISLNF